MIVNPQLFNYRLIISSLLVVLTALGIFSFTKYQSIESYEEFLKQEKVLIESELSGMLSSYDELSEDYNFMASQLQEAKLETKNTLDSLKFLNSDLSIITKFKDQLSALKVKSKILLSAIDSLNTANIKLQKEKSNALSTIKSNTKTISSLEVANDSLSKTIDNAAVLKTSDISAQFYKLKSGNKRYTDRARRANAIDVCITLAENPLTIKGEKDIYIQIVSPDGNVLSDQGEVVFGNSSLIFSKKEVVNYHNKNLEICTTIAADSDTRSFLKGYYFVNVFHKNVRLGSTNIKLK